MLFVGGILVTWCVVRVEQGSVRGRASTGVLDTLFGIGSVHKSVLGSLKPRKITVPLYVTSHFISSNVTMHPALHRGRIPMREAMLSDVTI
jgi:hypothetical protein